LCSGVFIVLVCWCCRQ